MANLRQREIEALLKAQAPARTKYFVNKVCDNEQVWGLKSAAGWKVVGDPAGTVCFPVWPHQQFAELCAAGRWGECRAESIPLDSWLDRWETGLQKDAVSVAVFPTPTLNGVVLAPKEINDLIRAGLEQIE